MRRYLLIVAMLCAPAIATAAEKPTPSVKCVKGCTPEPVTAEQVLDELIAAINTCEQKSREGSLGNCFRVIRGHLYKLKDGRP